MSPKSPSDVYCKSMDFTVVTPSLNQLDPLARAISSVADQAEVTLEHVVQDAGTRGFEQFAEKMKARWPDRLGYRRIMALEGDQGMYDAINRGLRKGTGRFCAYLNCDEQYLPGVLAKVKKEFDEHPKTEILYGGFLVVDSTNRLVAFRRPVKMFWQHVVTSHLPNFTCATFFRRSMLERDQAWFDPSYKACGDAVWTIGRLKDRIPTRNLDEFLAIFTEGTENQGVGSAGLAEARAIREKASPWVRMGAPLWKTIHRAQKIITGGYRQKPIQYQIFSKEQDSNRKSFYVIQPSPFWKSRLYLPLET